MPEWLTQQPAAIAAGLIAVFAILILHQWGQAAKAARAIRRQAALLNRLYAGGSGGGPHPGKSPDDLERILTRLIGKGYGQTGERERLLIVSRLRGGNHAAKQRLAAHIELMPQLGLLGTVVGLAINLARSDYSLPALGLALATTLIGLLCGIIAKQSQEIKSEEHYWRVMELLENPEVVRELTRPVPVADTELELVDQS